MSSVLYLTADEKKVFDGLSETVREGWNVELEKNEAWETDEQLAVRANIADFSAWPALRDMVDDARFGKDIAIENLKSMPQEVLPELFFTIGARGMTMIIRTLLLKKPMDEDIESIAALSMLRHDLFEANSSFSS
jgi:hypothetical protein